MDEEGGGTALNIEQGLQNDTKVDDNAVIPASAHTVDHGKIYT